MPANISVTFNTSSSQSLAGLIDAKFASQDAINLAAVLPAGTADNQCDLIVEKRAYAATSPDTIDLSLVADQSGNLAAFAKVKALIVCNKGATNPLSVAGSYFGTTAAIAVPPGGALCLLLPGGVDITADSNDMITIGSASGTDYELRIVGTAVPEEE